MDCHFCDLGKNANDIERDYGELEPTDPSIDNILCNSCLEEYFSDGI